MSIPNTTTASSRSNRNAVSSSSGNSAATTSEAREIAFSSEKKPIAWEATSRRTIISTNATNTIAPAIENARAGAWTLSMPSEPKQKNPNAAKTMQASTALAGFSV